jgi:N-acetylglucosaminyl-diphospho-decaprenol L-rhamnosyltransferase
MSQSEPSIGLMILNYNGKQWLPPLFESVRHNGYPNIRIYLVDNCSSDGSIEFILDGQPDVTVIRMPKNIGYGMAYNLAMPHAFADGCNWVIWANNDILLEPNCLSELMHVVQSDPNIGVAGPAFLSWDSDEPNYYMKGMYSHLIPAMQERSSIPVDVDWVEGSLLMVSRSTIDAVGSLDPHFFAYWEEAEFCRRVRYSGRRVVLVPSARARHYGGMSFSKESVKTMGDWLKARNYHIYKLTDPSRSFARNLVDSAHLLATNLKAALKNSPRAAFFELRAYAAVLVRIAAWRRKWRNDRRHKQPELLDRRHQGIHAEILFPAAREATCAK